LHHDFSPSFYNFHNISSFKKPTLGFVGGEKGVEKLGMFTHMHIQLILSKQNHTYIHFGL